MHWLLKLANQECATLPAYGTICSNIYIEFSLLWSSRCSIALPHPLAGADPRSWHRIAIEVIVDVCSVARVSRLDVSWDAHSAEALATSSSNLDLRTRDVELRGSAGVVNSELLDTQEVFAGGNAGWDRNAVGLCQIPGSTTPGECRADFLDLEP